MHPLNQVVIKVIVTAAEDGRDPFPFVEGILHRSHQVRVCGNMRICLYRIKFLLYSCQYGRGVFLSPLEIVGHGPAVASYPVTVLPVIEEIEQAQDLGSFRDLLYIDEPPLDVLKTRDSVDSVIFPIAKFSIYRHGIALECTVISFNDFLEDFLRP